MEAHCGGVSNQGAEDGTLGAVCLTGGHGHLQQGDLMVTNMVWNVLSGAVGYHLRVGARRKEPWN